jgi:hypothetical protein
MGGGMCGRKEEKKIQQTQSKTAITQTTQVVRDMGFRASDPFVKAKRGR